MLLTKLKITVCVATLAIVAGIGATGLTYRATAEEPKQVENKLLLIKSAETRPVSDDLDALRLEIEAMRKELRATKERVKTLEGEVRGKKGPHPTEALWRRTYEKEPESRRAMQPGNMLSKAQSALKKVIAEKAGDQESLEALQWALLRLTEQEKTKVRGQASPGGER